MFYEDDVADILNTDEFASVITANAGDTDEFTFNGIFDDAQMVQDMQTGRYIKAEPTIVCKTSDISTLSKSDKVTVNSIEYFIREILDDGTGVTLLRISLI